MGLAASQARLLSLTARMHDIEYKAQKLQAQKLQMANKSQQVYEEYETELNRTQIQYKTIGADGSASYRQATLARLYADNEETKATYLVKSTDNDKVYVTQAMVDRTTSITYTTEADGTITATMAGKTNNAATKEEAAAPLAGFTVDVVKAILDINYIAIDGDGESDWLTNMINEGFVVLEKKNKEGVFEDTSVQTDTSLQEVSNEVDLKKAEAKYEADMRKINTKDKKFDTDIAALEQERNAIKTEMETLKTVAKDNVERTFKLFS